MLVTGHQNTGEAGMSRSAVLGAVAAVGLAGNDGGSQHALCQVISRFEIVEVQETQEMRAVLAQTLGKAGILRVGEAPGFGDQAIELCFQRASLAGEGARRQGRLLPFQGQGLLQQAGRLAGKVQGSSLFGLVHLLEIFQQMAHAFLFEPSTQSTVVVGQVSIRGQDAGEVAAQDIEHHIAAAIGPDGVDGEVTMGEDPQPGGKRPDPPASLIDIHHTALSDGLQQFFIDRSSGASQLLICLAPATTADLQTKGVVEHFTDLTVRELPGDV